MIFQVLHDTICFQVLGNLQLDSPKTAHHVTQGKTIILNKEGVISVNVNALVRKEQFFLPNPKITRLTYNCAHLRSTKESLTI